MIPTWQDFTDKFGFNDGESTEARDWEMRDKLVDVLNKIQSDVKYEPFDRPGMHNACLIITGGDLAPEPDPELIEKATGCYNVEELIHRVYHDEIEYTDEGEDPFPEDTRARRFDH